MFSNKRADASMLGFLGYFVLAVFSSVLLISIFVGLFDIRGNTNQEIAEDVVLSIGNFVQYHQNSPFLDFEGCFGSLKLSNQETFQRTGVEDKNILGEGIPFLGRSKTLEERMEDRVFFFVVDQIGAYAFPISLYNETISNRDFDVTAAVAEYSFDEEVIINRDITGLELKTTSKRVCSGSVTTKCRRDCQTTCSGTWEYKDISTGKYEVKEEDPLLMLERGLEFTNQADFLIIYPLMGLTEHQDFESGDSAKEIEARYMTQLCSRDGLLKCGTPAQVYSEDYNQQLTNAAIAAAGLGVIGVLAAPFTGGLSTGLIVAAGGIALTATGAYINTFTTTEHNDATYLAIQNIRDPNDTSQLTTRVFSPISDFSEEHIRKNNCATLFFNRERQEQIYESDFSLTDYFYRDQIVLGWLDEENNFANSEEEGYFFSMQDQEIFCYERRPNESPEQVLSSISSREPVSCQPLAQKIVDKNKDIISDFSCVSSSFPGVEFDSCPLPNDPDTTLVSLLSLVSQKENDILNVEELQYLLAYLTHSPEKAFDDPSFFEYPFLVKFITSFYGAEEIPGELKVLQISTPTVSGTTPTVESIPFQTLFRAYPQINLPQTCELDFIDQCMFGKQLFDIESNNANCLGLCSEYIDTTISVKREFRDKIYTIQEERSYLNDFILRVDRTSTIDFDGTISNEKVELVTFDIENPNRIMESVIIEDIYSRDSRVYFYLDYPSEFFGTYSNNEDGGYGPEDYTGGGFYRFREDLLKRIPNEGGYDIVFNGETYNISDSTRVNYAYEVRNRNAPSSVRDITLYRFTIPRVQLPVEGLTLSGEVIPIDILLTQEQLEKIPIISSKDLTEEIEE